MSKKNIWDSLVKDLELNGTLFKGLVAQVLRTTGDPMPKEIRDYIADVLTGHKTWRLGSPHAPYKKWKRQELIENVTRAAEPLMAKLISDDYKPYMAHEEACKELANRFRTTPRNIDGILRPRKRTNRTK